MGWLITLGVVTLLAVLPLGVSVKYDAGGPLARVILGPVKFTVFPMPKMEKKKRKKKQPEKKQEPVPKTEEGSRPKPPQSPKPPAEEKPKEEKPNQEKKGGSLTDFIPFVKLLFNFLGDFRRKLRINDLQLKIIMAGGDPCDLAVNYGRAWAALSNLTPRLERWFVIKKKNMEIECDFAASDTLVIARLDLTITLGRLLSLVFVYAIRALKEFLNFKKKRKGGAVT